VLNPPLREAPGFTKLLHAVTLGEVGSWQIPETCLTSGPQEALDFVRGCRTGAIFKDAGATKTWATGRSTPCFEGYDERAGGAISRAIVEWLVTP
jgi:hypothetical protein